MLNWELLKHPLNWITILLMLTLAGIAGHMMLAHFGAEASGSGQSTLPLGDVTRKDFAALTLG